MDKIESKLVIAFPEPPQVLVELKGSNGDINKVAEIVASHETIAKEVLATINAPYFKLVREIKNSEEAVRMLGFNRVLNLTTGRLLRTTIYSGDSKLLKDLWSTSLKVAIIGVLISKELKIASTDEVYTASLFHNAGMGLLLDSCVSYPKIIKDAYKLEDSQISDFEQKEIGASHAILGGELARKWGLSSEISKTITLHHSPSELVEQIQKGDEVGELLLILKLSEKISRIAGYLTESPVDNEWEKIKEPIFDKMALTEGMFNRFELTIKKQFAEIKK